MRHFRICFGPPILVALLTLSLGCWSPAPPPKGSAGNDHPDEGPHGGTLVEWGREEYHPEFTVDHGKKQATVYILGRDARKPAPIKAESITLVIMNVKPFVTVTLKADPQQGDPEGTASRFVGQHEVLAKEMEFEGELKGMVGGNPYVGDLKEKPHGDHKGK